MDFGATGIHGYEKYQSSPIFKYPSKIHIVHLKYHTLYGYNNIL